MLSGIKEIIIILCVLVGLFTVPRILRMRSGKTESSPPGTQDINQPNKGLMRLSILASVLWLALAFILLNPVNGSWTLFLAAGVLPVVFGWGLRWVVLGFKR